MPITKVTPKHYWRIKGKLCAECGILLEGEIKAGREVYVRQRGGALKAKYFCKSCKDAIFGGVSLRKSYTKETEEDVYSS